MPLSPDAKALLELILARGQSYEDIASLLEVPEAEVRSRARAALAELGGADPDRNVALTDWILGQADPITRADVARHVRDDADDHRLASELIAALRDLSPEADLPKLPGESAPSPRRASADAPSRLSSLTSQQSRLLVILASAAVLVVAIVLAVTGVFGGDDDSSTASTGADAGTGTEATADAPSEDIQTVPLSASGGGDAEGSATFGIASGSQAFVELDIARLEPAPAGKAYVLWLLVSEDQGHPLTPFQVDQGGTYSEQIPIASFLTQIAARTRFVDVSLSPRKPLLDEVASAVDDGTPIINYTGESILRGTVEATGGGADGGADTTTPAP